MATPVALCHYRKLCAAIAPCGSAAVALSGGVDSTLLLHAARTALGGRVVAFNALSPLQKPEEQQRAVEAAARCGCQLVRFEFSPLEWPEFVANPPNRCYLCKKKTYSLFSAHLADHGAAVLLDGTNADDLNDDRPGLVALAELGVLTPLATAGLRKTEVRACAREIGIPAWDAPSSSCLATRIGHGQAITQENIGFVAKVEEYLTGRGFAGCRVRWGAKNLTIEVRAGDIPRLTTLSTTPLFRKMASQKGFRPLVLAQRNDR